MPEGIFTQMFAFNNHTSLIKPSKYEYDILEEGNTQLQLIMKYEFTKNAY